MRLVIKKYICLILFIGVFVVPAEANPPQLVKGLVHVHSYISSGIYSPETLVEKAQKKDVKVLFFTENILLRWEYGVPPLRNVIKKVVKKDSFLSYGPEKYFQLLEKLKQDYPDIVLLPSVEVAPVYYWTGNILKKTFTLNRWDQQLLVIGLQDPLDYKNLPFVGNPYQRQQQPFNMYLMWPILFLLVCLGGLKKINKYKGLWITGIIVSLLFLWNNFPFSKPMYDQYHGDQGLTPYQDLIDYVHQKGGLTFWSAPEADTDTKMSGIKIVSPSFEKDLLKTSGYTGFAGFYEGYRELGGVGGIWDILLEQYCQKQRSHPVWTMGEMAYHGDEAGGRKKLDDVQTIFLIDEISDASVIDALKNGKMYALRRKDFELVLEDFRVMDVTGKSVFSGGELQTQGPVRVRFKISNTKNKEQKIQVQLIKNGKLLQNFQLNGEGEELFFDNDLREGALNYYRLFISSDYPHKILTNPIFVDFKL